MTLAVEGVQSVRRRLAQHYLHELQSASAAFRGGYDHSAYGLALFDREWPQIQHWQAWSAARSAQDRDSASLCAHFPPAGDELLALRQTPHERMAWLEAGRQAARQIGDRRAEAACVLLLAWALHKQALLTEAEATAREALALAEAVGERLYIGRGLHLLGEIAVRRGRFDEAQRLHQRSLDQLQAAGDQAHLAEVYFSLSELAYLCGEFATAHDYAVQSHAVLQALGLSPTTNNNLTWLGVTTKETTGDLEAAEGYVRQSVNLCRAAGAQSTLAHALYILSALLRLMDDIGQAQATLHESLQIAQVMGEEWLIPYILIERSQILGQLGDWRAALPDADQALGIARQSGYRLALSTALAQRADVLCGLGQADAAGEALREGLDVATETKMTTDLARGTLVAARLWRLRGLPGLAAEWVGLLLSRREVELAIRRGAAALGQPLEAELGSAAYALALERGRTLTLDSAVADISAALRRV